MGKIDKVRQTNVMKLVHNWIHDGLQNDLFIKQTHFTQCPVECGKNEYLQHYMACYAPTMNIQKNKCMHKLTTTWKGLTTATPIARAMKYIITCVISETDTLQHKFRVALTSSFDTMLFKTWKEQQQIGWCQIFKGRISAKWTETQCLYYAFNPDTRVALSFSPSIWASKTMYALIEIALERRTTRNTQLHSISPEEKRKIQREMVTQIAKSKYA